MQEFISQIFSQQTIDIIEPLVYYTFGIAIYGIVIFHFYRILAKRDILKLNLRQYAYESDHPLIKNTFAAILYTLEYIIIFPILTFIWFGALSIILILLTESQATSNLMLISMAIVASARITAYYNEDLSKDIAKLLPFSLLAVFIIDRSFTNPSKIIPNMEQIKSFFNTILIYGLFTIVMELILKIYWELKTLFFPIDED